MGFNLTAIRTKGNFFTNDTLEIQFPNGCVLDGWRIRVQSRKSLRWYHIILEYFFGQTWATIEVQKKGKTKHFFVHINQLATALPELEIKEWAKAGILAKKILSLAASPRFYPLLGQIISERPDWERIFNSNPNLKILKYLIGLENQLYELYVTKDKKIPHKLRIFLKEEELGKGKFKTVFQLINIENATLKALSQMSLKHKHLVKNATELGEAQAMQTFPNTKTILQSSEIEEIDSNEYMVMKFCDLGNLDDYHKKLHRELTSEEQQRIIKELLEAVQIMHSQDFVHQDIKPENVFLYKDKQGLIHAKLGDLGFVARNKNAKPTLGSPLFFSPEKIAFHPNCAKQSDIFGLGLVLFKLLKNNHPYSDDYRQNHLGNFQFDTVNLKKDLLKTYTQWNSLMITPIEQLILKLIHPERDQRWTIEQACELFFRNSN